MNGVWRAPEMTAAAAKRRARIAKAVLALLGRARFAGAALRDIAKTAKVTLDELEREYPTQSHLLVIYHDDFYESLLGEAESLSSTSGFGLLRGFFRLHAKRIEADAAAYRVYRTEFFRNPALFGQPPRSARATQLLTRAIAMGIERGEFRADLEPFLVIHAALDFWNEGIRIWLDDPSFEPLPRFEQKLELLLSGMRPKLPQDGPCPPQRTRSGGTAL